ncbi:YybH family protein [Salipiger mangrovisoli]|uniref:SgcJ/EcaC family oxidoreductase n=1 Tax=Salipiger mangrovisoli TaxID=2865933 RepID=A0ABR9WZ42_9RHOB|nr:SgcJ/EcaC family oxidoreductase [Salipiger mangrovisoli]MBE9636570.1 SgcJ/EcaC family oxidoreductase [Salipiger mangrovisoli]
MAAPTPIEPPRRPEDFPAAFADAWARRDGAAIAALFAEDAEFVNVTGLWWTGRDAIARPHDYALKSFFAETTLRPGRVSVRQLGPQHAVVRCRFHMDGQRAPDGAEAGPRQTILIFVLERGASGWQAVAAQNTEVMPGQETFLARDGLSPTSYRRG